MWHLRIIAVVWLLFGILGMSGSLFDLSHNVASGAFASAIESDFIALAFCVAAAFTGYGVFRRRRWARVISGITSVVFLLYALSYLLLVGLEFGVLSYALIWIIAAFFRLFTFRDGKILARSLKDQFGVPFSPLEAERVAGHPPLAFSCGEIPTGWF